ncbi:unnamed protein product [Parascedosporium putredinis]|uniref:MTHFR SAM-binding regulatory domain-containing protein n=1 Tax=Parascedosporium putredinis TaxID=1442378 RepID=A0A9P1GU82_9PEZI|nr:unnamed protein product [Parascedosporium putredinis]CAI7987465.1 unnamed protein product [Parascedosporium putredinis]
MDKITDKIAALPPDAFYTSLEFFPPKTVMGFSNLRDRLDRMERALKPLFICQRELGLTTCLHLTCTNMSRRLLDKALEDAKALGIRNLLALRGDPPRPDEYKALDDASSDEVTDFEWATDLVKYIKATYGDYFCIGGPPYLVEKVQAGADFIITQLFFDVDIYEKFETALREHPSGAFKTIPIIPGLMPIQSYQMVKRTTKLSHASVPDPIMARLDAVKGDDEKVKSVGVDILSEIVENVKKVKARTPGPRGFHFYTLNLEKAVSFILERSKLIPVSDSDDEDVAVAETDEALRNTIPIVRVNGVNGTNEVNSNDVALGSARRLSTVGSDPRNRVIVSGAQASHPDYEATAGEAGIPAEPVNTRANTLAISEGEGVLGREATWDDFPNGRWGDARSPPIELWGTPTSVKDVSDIFLRHLQGTLAAIPWSEEGLLPETNAIHQHLVNLNNKGWWSVASQPAVNGFRSSDHTFGWGPENGFVFQKSFVEFFLPTADWNALRAKLQDPAVHESICFYAANVAGDFESSDAAAASPGGSLTPSTNAVTWGVFPEGNHHAHDYRGTDIVEEDIRVHVFHIDAEEDIPVWNLRCQHSSP